MENIPTTSHDITESWLISVLSNHGKEIKVLELKSVKNEGGVLSSVFKAKVDIDGNEVKLFIKIMPHDEGQRVFIENQPIDAIEIKTYDKILPMLQDFESSEFESSIIKSMACRYFGGQSSLSKDSRGFYVILEDISEIYQMPKMEKGLTSEQILDGLKKLAYFHGLSYCYAKKHNVDFLKDNVTPYFEFFKDPGILQHIGNMFKRIIHQMKSREENDLVEILTKLSSNYIDKFKWAYDGRCGDFLTHGDIWATNLMFKGNDVS